jgi:hypothetical protein
MGLLMAGALVAALAGLRLDPRVITGAPAWLKPAKFAASTAIYAFTLAWMFAYLPDWPRTRRSVSWITAVVLVFEVGAIFFQAWRGTTSHFNVSTPVDAAIFAAMGLGIIVQMLASTAVAVALWRQRFDDAALGWALRLGMTISIVGASVGGLMTRPTSDQLAEARATHRLTVAGAHTVGAPDGGQGLPGIGWSVAHGDLRVPHFVGLHAMQALPFLVLALPRRREPDPRRVRLAVAAAISYVGFFALLLTQALRGESLVTPSAFTAGTLATWASVTVVAFWLIAARRTPESSRSAAVLG